MTKDVEEKFDLSIPRRCYHSRDCRLTKCPECGLPLIPNECSVIIAAKSDSDEVEFMSNATGSHFCNACPVIVIDSDKLEEAIMHGMRGTKNLKYLVAGIVDFKAIPEEKKHLGIGSDENPVPLVHFLPGLYKKTIITQKTTARNAPCTCGSGKKYKRCCG